MSGKNNKKNSNILSRFNMGRKPVKRNNTPADGENEIRISEIEDFGYAVEGDNIPEVKISDVKSDEPFEFDNPEPTDDEPVQEEEPAPIDEEPAQEESVNKFSQLLAAVKSFSLRDYLGLDSPRKAIALGGYALALALLVVAVIGLAKKPAADDKAIVPIIPETTPEAVEEPEPTPEATPEATPEIEDVQPEDEAPETAQEGTAEDDLEIPVSFEAAAVKKKDKLDNAAIFDKVRGAVVKVSDPETATFEEAFINDEIYTSAGIVVTADGYMLTYAGGFKGSRLWVDFEDGFRTSGTVCGIDPETGTALVKLELEEEETVPYVGFGAIETPVVGSEYPTVEYDGDVMYAGMNMLSAVCDDGLVFDDAQAAGTAIFDEYGRLCAFVTGERAGRAFAVTADRIMPGLNEITVYGKVKGAVKPGFGIAEVIEVNDVLAKRFGLSEGLYIAAFKEDSTAERAGLVERDVITSVNGVRVYTEEEFYAALSGFAPDETVEVEFTHGNGLNVIADITVMDEYAVR